MDRVFSVAILALPYLLIASAAGLVGLLAWTAFSDRQKHVTSEQLRWERARLPVAIALLSIAWWELFYAVELLSQSESWSIASHRVVYLGTCCLPPAFLWAVGAGRRQENPIPRRWILLLWVPPAVSLGLLAIGHDAFWAPDGLLSVGPYSGIGTVRGPWFWVHTAYSYGCILAGSVWVLQAYARAWRARRSEGLAILAGVAAPWVSNGLHLFFNVGNVVDITSLALVPTGLLLYWVLRRNRLQAILPIAHAAIFDQMDDCLFIVDGDGEIVSANQSARNLLAARGSSSSSLLHESWPELAQLGKRAPNKGVISGPDASGDACHFDARVSRINDDTGLHAIAMRDVTDRVMAESLLSERATRDELTGLSNRSHFHEAVELIFQSSDAATHALLLFDLDDFKLANDTLGHAAGDELLRQVGIALSSGIRRQDVCARMDCDAETPRLARLGGDEFAVLITGLRKPDDAFFVAERLLREIQNHQGRWNLCASVGIAMAPGDGATPDALFQAADAALYHAKSEGGSRVAFFQEQFNKAAERRHVIERRLAEIRAGAGLRLCFQPKVEVGTGRLVGVEALLRWTDSELGCVAPSEFIPVAERTGSIQGIGRWVIEEACRQIHEWRDAGLEPPPVAVNVAGPQLRERGFYDHLTATLKAHRLPTSSLQIEITESTLLSPDSDTIQMLQELRYIGVRVWLDDFGTGFSSLSYLNSFQLDGLKLDQSFVRDIDTNHTAQSIAIGIVTIAKRLGLSVVAEGVETDAEAKHIEMLEVDEIQGYLYSKPLEVEATRSAIENKRILAGQAPT